MSFFDNFTKNASVIIGKVAKDTGSVIHTAFNKSSDFAEVSKLKMKISAEDKSIEELYFKIGRKIYEDCVENGMVAETVQDECSSVYEHKARIAELQGRIELIRGENGYNEAQSDVDFDSAYNHEVTVEEVSSVESVKEDEKEIQYGVITDLMSEKKEEK